MKTKIITKIIKRKVDKWLESIKDEKLREEVKDNVIVTGGCIVSMLLNEKVNDYDIYIKDPKVCFKLAVYYVEIFNAIRKKKATDDGIPIPITVKYDEVSQITKLYVKSAGLAASHQEIAYQYFETESGSGYNYIDEIQSIAQDLANQEKKGDFNPVFMSANAITLSDGIQIVTRFTGDPEEIHKNFDFVHCQGYWTREKKVVLTSEILECIITKTLTYNGSRYPLATIFRLRKFIRRDWTITAGQLTKIMWQISDLNLTDFDTLEDQLTGVDTAYFMEIIDKLKERDPDKVDEAYLFQLLDSMF